MMSYFNKMTFCATLALAAALGGGCAAPKPSGFLGNYENLTKVDGSTWRYVDKARLATYDNYMIAPVTVLVKSYESVPLTPSQQEQAGRRFHDIIAKAIAGQCHLVDKPTGKTAEIRAAITAAYPVGPALTLGLEGEIVDAASGQQLAAVRKYQAGPPQVEGGPPQLVDENYGNGWWNLHSSVWIMEQWADQLHKAMEKIDNSPKK
jgi:hypothetical protein